MVLPGRGVIVSVQRTNVRSGVGDGAVQVCVFTVEVSHDGWPRYAATCRQAVRSEQLTNLTAPGVQVPVEIDAADRSRVTLALDDFKASAEALRS